MNRRKVKMNKRKVKTEFDDDEILNKLNALLYRYRNRVEETNDLNEVVDSSQSVASIPENDLPKTEQIFDDEIPTLTEIVLLQSEPIQTQTGRSLSLQQILDTALNEVNIEMKTSDRIMLTKALEKQLTKI